MFLFIHGTGATNSLWLPQIRELFELGPEFSDTELIKHFTIQLPGHVKDDRYFEIVDIKRMIDDFREQNRDFQQHLAPKFLLGKHAKLAQCLQDERLILVGHSVGGVISLHYTADHMESVRGLVLIGCGHNFNPLVKRFGTGAHRKLKRKDLRKLNELAPKIKNIRQRLLVNIFAENPDRKGFQSCLDIVNKHNATQWYKLLSLDQQRALNKLPILLINGRFDSINTVLSAQKFAKILRSREDLLEKPTTVINQVDNQKNQKQLPTSNFELKIYPWSTHEPMDDAMMRFVNDLKEFSDRT
jgi:pimeloyl-ACP methyl ester carboxylesterase